MQLSHYHLITSRVREVEARYVGKLAFELVARHGRIGDEYQSLRGRRLVGGARPDGLQAAALGARARRGQYRRPARPVGASSRGSSLGLAFDEEEFADVIDRAAERELRIQAHGGRRTFIATNSGYRLEVHPPREWLDELLGSTNQLVFSELHLRADLPEVKAVALAELLEAERDGTSVHVGNAVVRFLPSGPQGRPQLHAELLV